MTTPAPITDRRWLDDYAARHDLKPGTIAWATFTAYGTLVGFTNGTSRTYDAPDPPPRSMNP